MKTRRAVLQNIKMHTLNPLNPRGERNVFSRHRCLHLMEVLGTTNPLPTPFQKDMHSILVPKFKYIAPKFKYVVTKFQNIAPKLKYVSPKFNYLTPNLNSSIFVPPKTSLFVREKPPTHLSLFLSLFLTRKTPSVLVKN